MSSKLVKKLHKELKKSPGKAGVLALLLAVAVWFWSPLIWNLMGESNASQPVSNVIANEATSTSGSQAATGVSKEPHYSWKQIAEAIDKDPLMMPAEKDASTKDPFRGLTPKKPIQIVEEQPIAVVPALDVTPAGAGLVLTSTIVGPGRRVARLNGKSYRVGDLIDASVDDKTIRYIVLSIDAKSVRLSLGEKEYEMKMLRRGEKAAATSTVGVSSDSPDFDPSILE